MNDSPSAERLSLLDPEPPSELAPRDISALLALIAELSAVRSLRQLRKDAVEVISTLITCSLVAWNEIDMSRPNVEVEVELQPDFLSTLPPARANAIKGAFATHIAEHPVIRYFQETGDGRPHTISDFWSEATFHATPLYQEFYGQPEVAAEDQLSITLPQTEALIGIALNRPARDFTGRDRELLNLLRPHLVQAHRNGAAFDRMRWLISRLEEGMPTDGEGLVLLSRGGVPEDITPQGRLLLAQYFSGSPGAGLPPELRDWVSNPVSVSAPPWPFVREGHDARLLVRRLPRPDGTALLLTEQAFGDPLNGVVRSLGLTGRQAEVMGLVAEALSTKQIALRLGISPRTVEKHIEGALRALGADSRQAAANLIRQAGHRRPHALAAEQS